MSAKGHSGLLHRSTAVASIGQVSMTRAVAVFRLHTISNFIAYRTSTSAGFAPFQGNWHSCLIGIACSPSARSVILYRLLALPDTRSRRPH